jgi:hypothetical protein
MQYEYAILAFKRWQFDRVTLPDGTVREVRFGKGMALLETWFERHVSPQSYETVAEVHAAWEMRYRAWRSTVDVRHEEVLNPELSTRYKRVVDSVDVVRLPSGATRTVAAGRADDLLWDHYQAQIEPEPSSETVTFESWLAGADVAIEPSLQGWRTTLQIDDTVETIGESCTTWATSIPESALPLLNSLGREGWEVVAVNEDKGTVGDTQPESGSAAIRYLLKRSAAVEPARHLHAYTGPADNVRMA